MSEVSVRMTLVDDVSSKMQRITNSARTAAAQFSNAGRAMEAAFQSNSAASFASQAGNAINSVESNISSLGNAIDDTLSGFDNFYSGGVERLEADFSRAAESADDLSDNVSDTAESIDDLASAAGDLGDGFGGMDDLADGARNAGESMEQATSKAINFGDALKKMLAVVSAAAVLDKVGDFARESINIGRDYTSMMSEVAAISGASGRDLELMEATAREYGATTVFSASESAEALKYMSLAGWDAQQSSSAIGGVLNLAAASGMGLGQASDMVTDYLSAFKMDASQSGYFADMLAYAQSNSNTTAEQLGEAYRNSAANLNAAGQDVETTTSLLEAMANQGYKGSEAGTALAATMRDITQKMEDGAISIGDTSIAVQDQNGNFRDLTDILTDVEAATDGMGDAQKAAALGSTFTSDSIKALNMILAEGMDKVSGYEEELRNASGTAEDMAGVMNDNLSGDIANLESAYEEMQLQVFEGMESPLRSGAQYLTDTIVPTLTEWVPDAFGSMAEGVQKFGSALAPMIETVLKNPRAVGAAFTSIGAGVAAMKTISTGTKIANMVSDAGGVVGALSKMGTSIFGSPWAAGAAAVAAAVTAVGFAVKEYNDLRIEENLNAHFGRITLDDSQIEDLSSHVIDADWLVNINAALGHFESAEQLYSDAEEALEKNDALEWKAKVGITLTESDQSSYIKNIEAFSDNIEKALSERTLAAEMVVKQFDIKSAEGMSLGDEIEKWAKADMQEMSELSAGLTRLVQNALQDGIIDVDEQAAIDILQGKISNIMSGWQEAEAQAQMDMLTRKYGRLSGSDLDDGTFLKVVDELRTQRETAVSALEESEKELYTTLNALNRTDANGVQRISDAELIDYKEQASFAARNSEASMLANSVIFEKNTLSDVYGEKLNQNYANMEQGTSKYLDNVRNLFSSGDMVGLYSSLENAYSQSMEYSSKWNPFSNSDQIALQDIYNAMKPDVNSMTGLIDEYKAMGQAIPEDVMTAFNDAMMIGAASGDTDAAWQVFANQMISDPANNALIQAIQDGTVNVPDELQAAIERATAETTPDPITIEGMQAEIEEVEVNKDRVDELLNMAFEGLEATGEVTEIEGGQIAVEFEVTAGQTMSEIAAQAGIALDELIAANPQIENPNLIYVGQKINIPASQVDVDANGVGQAVEEAVQSEAGGETTVDKTITQNTTYVAGETDTSQVEHAAQQQIESDPTATTVPTAITFSVSEINDSELAGAMTSYLKEQPAVPVDVPVSLTAKKENDNFAAISGEFRTGLESNIKSVFGSVFRAIANMEAQCGSDNFASTASAFASRFDAALKSAFNRTFYATANASINVNYSIANPTKTISFSGGGSGTATVYAHALGGYFTEPHIGIVAEAGTPEFVIPDDGGTANSIGLWQQAGKNLGLLNDGPLSVPPMPNGIERGRSGTVDTVQSSGSRTIDININGNGRIGVGGGISKDDVLDIIMEKVRDVFIDIVQEEALIGGDAAYEY